MEINKVQMFHDAYITANEPELDRLWKEESPKSFIKFYPGRYESDGKNYFLEHLENKTIWLSLPELFNDPFDCAINVDFTNDILAIQKEVLKEEFGAAKVDEIMNSSFWKNNMKFCNEYLTSNLINLYSNSEKVEYVGCFSEPENLYSKIMWSHYANSHYGVCAEYDFDSVNKISPYGCIPIKYSDTYEFLMNFENNIEKVKNFLRLIYCKSEEWAYEKEWRVMIQREHISKQGFNAPFSLPRKIYLCCRVGKKLKSDILEFSKSKDIPVFQAKIKPGTFSIEFYECV